MKTNQYAGTFRLMDYGLYKGLTERRGGRCVAPAIPCVYVITNERSGLRYVGSTQDFFARWRKHYHELRGGYHGIVDLQSDYAKHADAFTISIIETYDEAGEELMRAEERIGYELGTENLYNARIGVRYIRGAYGQNVSGPKPSRRNVRVQSKPRWYDGIKIGASL